MSRCCASASTIELQPITWGDSDAMLAGMPVLAIGNPLGFGFTVSHGIVSALDRDIKETAVDSFIQVDAPINPGNSGGPLFDINGEVIGMNTALETVDAAGGSVGLGFAIPGNDLQFVVNQLKEFGRVRLGATGVVAQNLTQDMADAVGLPYPQGVVIAFIPASSTAAASQLRVGDIILQVNGNEIPNVRRLTRVTGALGVGTIVPFLVLRDGVQVAVPVKIGEEAASADPRNRPDGGPDAAAAHRAARSRPADRGGQRSEPVDVWHPQGRRRRRGYRRDGEHDERGCRHCRRRRGGADQRCRNQFHDDAAGCDRQRAPVAGRP